MSPADRLRESIATVPARLSGGPFALVEERNPRPNNHQRFVRTQLAPAIESPGYEQERSVRTQAYATESWPDLIALWRTCTRYHPQCAIGGSPPVTVEFLVQDYVAHLEHHVAQIFAP